MSGFLDPAMVPVLLTGVLMLALAGILLGVDFNNSLHRVFALVLSLNALIFIVAVVRAGASSEMQLVLTWIIPYLTFPLTPLYILFISLYPHPRGLGKWRHGPLAVGGVSIALLLWYMLDHAAYGVIAPTPEGFLDTAGRGRAFIEYGPFFLLNSVQLAIGGVLALIMARDYWKDPQGNAGFSRFLVYAGFALNALFNGTFGLFGFIQIVQAGVEFPWLPFGWAQFAMRALNLPLALASLIYIYKASKGEGDTPTLQEPRRFLYYVTPLPIISGVILAFPTISSSLGPTFDFVLGLWRLSVPVLITYALLRFQVFGTDVAIKQSVAKVILVVVFAIIFFTVLEAIEALLGDMLGFWPNIVLAAGLALAASPLQKLAGRVADSVMPDTKSVYEQDPYERGEFYMGQYQLVIADGEISAKDRDMLNRLALSLRISNAQQKELERGVNRLPRIEGYRDQIKMEETRSRTSRLMAALLTAAVFGGIGQGLEALFPSDSFGFSLVAGALVTLLIGPLESLVDKVLEPPLERQARRHRVQTYRSAVIAAFVDGNVSAKERNYLDRLQKELGLSQTERIRIHMRVARSVG